MIQSVIYNRQNLIEFYNNTFVYEMLSVENNGNKNWNKKTAVGNKHFSEH
jgi:hypothetical protein